MCHTTMIRENLMIRWLNLTYEISLESTTFSQVLPERWEALENLNSDLRELGIDPYKNCEQFLYEGE